MELFNDNLIRSAIQELTTKASQISKRIQKVTNEVDEIPSIPTPKTADRGKFLKVKANANEYMLDEIPSEVPVPTIADAGKVIGVNENGLYALLEASGGYTLIASKNITINLKNDTSWDSWTPSTSETDIKAAGSSSSPEVTISNTDYDRHTESLMIITNCVSNFSYIENAPLAKLPISVLTTGLKVVVPYANTVAGISNAELRVGTNKELNIGNTTLYYDSNGNEAIAPMAFGAYSYSYVTKLTSTQNGYVIYLDKIVAKCNTNYFPTTNFQYIDSENSSINIDIKVYKFPADNPLSTFLSHSYPDMKRA